LAQQSFSKPQALLARDRFVNVPPNSL
jgi:hypothetical protein